MITIIKNTIASFFKLNIFLYCSSVLLLYLFIKQKVANKIAKTAGSEIYHLNQNESNITIGTSKYKQVIMKIDISILKNLLLVPLYKPPAIKIYQ